MHIKTPKFWYRSSFCSYLLLPLAGFYLFVTMLRKFLSKEFVIAKNVVVIGNVTVGGGGKTPITIALSELLTKKKKKFCILSRGYKGKVEGPYWVQKDDSTSQVGDEALLLAKKYPCIISKDRRNAKELIAAYDPDMVLLDDGLQNPTFKKDYKILLIDNHFVFGNNLIFPAGPLRVSAKKGVLEADSIIIIKENRKDKINDDLTQLLKENDKKFFTASPVIKKSSSSRGYIAFSGLAINDKFFRSLSNHGYNIVETVNYPDHYAYEETDIVNLLMLAKEKNLRLITTAKDAIKIADKYRKDIEILDYQLKIIQEQELLDDIITKFS